MANTLFLYFGYNPADTTVMAIFNFFGESEHRVFNYKPVYYDKEKEELRQKFGHVDGSQANDKEYVPGSYIRGSFKDGAYSKTRTHSTKAQNVIGIVGLLLVFLVLFYIAKYYTLL